MKKLIYELRTDKELREGFICITVAAIASLLVMLPYLIAIHKMH